MKSIKCILFVINLILAVTILAHSLDQIHVNTFSIVLNFEVEEKSENTSGEEDLNYSCFESEFLKGRFPSFYYLNSYTSSYLNLFEVPPEYC